MTTATTLGGPLYAVAPATHHKERFALLLRARAHARQAFDRVLAVPRAAVAYVRSNLRFSILAGTPLGRAGGWLLMRLSVTRRAVRSVGIVPLGLVVASSATVQRLVARLVRGTGRVCSRLTAACGRGLRGFLSAFGSRGVKVADRLQSVAHRVVDTVRSASAAWMPRVYLGLAAAGVALEVSRPLLRGVLVHRLLSQYVPSRLLRGALQLLVMPALVDGRAAAWLHRIAAAVTRQVRRLTRADVALVVVDLEKGNQDDAASDSPAEVPVERPVPQNRAERREAQRQEALARRRPRTA